MQRIVFILFTCFLVAQSAAQSFILQGKVTDKDQNPVELASVSVLSQGKATFTSLKGDFSIELQSEDSVVVKFSMIGYKTKTRVLRNPRGKQTLQIQLFEDETNLGEVLVMGQRTQTGQVQELKTSDLKKMTSASGNAVEALIQSQAGVSSHNELSSQYNVRGGSFDENSVYINGTEIYRPFLVRSGQQEGLSIINPYMVEKIGFSTGGYAAKYGDKMSSALDISYKTLRPSNGHKNAFEASLALSLLGAEGYVGVANKQVSWLNSIRYKTNSYLLGTFETTGEYRPDFMDYQTYLNWQPNKRWAINFIGNVSDNHYNFIPKDRETTFGTLEDVKSFRVYFDGQEKDLFRTYFGALGITRHLGDSTSVSLIASAFHTNERETYDIQGQYWLTQTETSENLGVGTYFQHARNRLKAHVESLKMMFRHTAARHDIEAGITLKKEHIEELAREYEMRDSAGYSVPHTGRDLKMIYSLRASNILSASRTELYLQDTWKFSADSGRTVYSLNYGARFAHWSYSKENIFSPRAALSIYPAFNPNMTFRIAAGLYYQAPFFKELRDTVTTQGTTYAYLNPKIKSQQSIHFITAFDYRFKINERPYKFTAEAYYKALSHLIPYSVNNVKVTYYGDNMASGHAMGLDLKLYGEFVPGTDSWVTLSIMNTRMKLNGRSIPLPTDQRFSVNLFFTDYFPGTERWKMNLKLAYADGLPFSTPHRELETNTFRAPAYRRADMGMSYRLLNNEDRHSKSPFKNIWLGLDFLNLLGISNVNSYYWVTDVTNNQYAVPNYLTGRQVNARVLFEF